MNRLFGGIILQFREFFKSLGPTKRLAIIAVSIIVGLMTIILGIMLSGKDYVALFTNVPADQLPLIVAKLNEKNIQFQVRDDGNTISVSRELLHSTQMALMSELGSTKMGNIGLELFEKQDFGVNSYAQRVNFQRALQGELMRAINTLTAVKQSKVILALPTKKNFLEEGNKASASVVLEMYQGKELAAEQIRGIRYLVANAVEGLDPERVTVLDERGKVLTRESSGSTAGSSEILELKQKIESDLEVRIEQILSKLVGQAKVVAKVDATINHRMIQSVEETVDAEGTAVRSQTTEEESLDGSRSSPNGVPGARANLPGAEDGGQVGFKQDVKKEHKVTAYEVPKTVKNIREQAGNLERISVAVVVDGVTTTTTAEDGKTTSTWTARTPEELAKYENLIKSAIGYNAQRGDSVKIENVAFQPEDFTESEKLLTNLERKKIVQSLFKWALLGFSMALFFFVVVRPFMQWISDSFQDSVEDMLPRTIEELEELQAVDNTLPGMSSALPVIQESVDPEKAETELLKDRIIGLMGRDEEKAASAFGMWLVRKE